MRETLGQRLATIAVSALLVDRLMLGSLAAVVVAHYLVAFGRSVVGVTTPSLVGDSGPMTLALAAIAIVWWLQRQGRSPLERTVAQIIGASVIVLVLLAVCATVSVLFSSRTPIPLNTRPAGLLSLAIALGFVLSALGSVESLSSGRTGPGAAADSQPAARRQARWRLRDRHDVGAGVSFRRVSAR